MYGNGTPGWTFGFRSWIQNRSLIQKRKKDPEQTVSEQHCAQVSLGDGETVRGHLLAPEWAKACESAISLVVVHGDPAVRLALLLSL
jgi:hypothetical protein